MCDEDATVAQLVEQLIRNQQVGGSSPPSSSIFILSSKINYIIFVKLISARSDLYEYYK